MILHIKRCWSGRLWINFFRGFFALGIGCGRVRVYWRRRLVRH